MPVFAVIDGGGTKTRCWIADESQVFGRASGETVKIMNVGEELATVRLQALVREAAMASGVPLGAVERTCIGLAGSSSEQVRHWAAATLGSLVGGEILISGDEEIALDAAFRGGPGILVIAGTGSNVAGRCSDGTLVTVGGWGPILGDEGAGSWIGLEAIRAGLRAQDRGIETCLLREIEGFWELRNLGELVARANQRQRPDFSELAGVVASCADGGDALAMSVLERAGEELAAQVSLLASKMKAARCAAADSSHVAFTGSVLEKISRVRRSLEGHLRAVMPEVEVAGTPVEPLEGALWRVRRG